MSSRDEQLVAIRCRSASCLLAVSLFFTVAVSSPVPALPEGKGVEQVTAKCSLCHGLELVAQQRLDREGWTRVVDQMIVFGAPVQKEERQDLITYLETYLGPQPAQPEPR
jgi:hypothetical protein